MPSPMLKPCQLSAAAARARAARVSWRQPVSIAVSRDAFAGCAAQSWADEKPSV